MKAKKKSKGSPKNLNRASKHQRLRDEMLLTILIHVERIAETLQKWEGARFEEELCELEEFIDSKEEAEPGFQEKVQEAYDRQAGDR